MTFELLLLLNPITYTITAVIPYADTVPQDFRLFINKNLLQFIILTVIFVVAVRLFGGKKTNKKKKTQRTTPSSPVSRGRHVCRRNGSGTRLHKARSILYLVGTDAIYSFVWEFHQRFNESSAVFDTAFMRPVTFYVEPSAEMLMRCDGQTWGGGVWGAVGVFYGGWLVPSNNTQKKRWTSERFDHLITFLQV